MTSYHAWTHRPKEQGGTDPIAFESNRPYAYVLHDGVPSVPTDDWYSPADDSPWVEGFISESSTHVYDLDLDTGIIQWLVPGLYLITANALLGDSLTVGNEIGVSIDVGDVGLFSGERYGTSITADGDSEAARAISAVQIFCFNPNAGSNSVRADVHHNEGIDLAFDEVRMQVVQLSASVAGEFYTPS